MAKYVDTGRMATLLNIFESYLKNANDKVNSFSTATPSLGESSFAPTIQANLEKIRTTYEELLPQLDVMRTNIEEVKSEYGLRSESIQSTNV